MQKTHSEDCDHAGCNVFPVLAPCGGKLNAHRQPVRAGHCQNAAFIAKSQGRIDRCLAWLSGQRTGQQEVDERLQGPLVGAAPLVLVPLDLSLLSRSSGGGSGGVLRRPCCAYGGQWDRLNTCIDARRGAVQGTWRGVVTRERSAARSGRSG